MGVPEASEKGPTTSPADLELSSSTITSTQEPHPKKLHFVQRSDVIPEYDGSEENITGYDADLMRARASLSADEENSIRAPILEKYEREGSPYYSTARLWDDGILDPAETRQALALGLSAAFNAPIPDAKFGIFRM